MENQHRLITGYRELTQEEIDLMNDVKAAGANLDALVKKVSEHIGSQYMATQPRYREPASDAPDHADNVAGTECIDTHEEIAAKRAEVERLKDAEPGRWCSIAKTHLQQGLMALGRAVAQAKAF